MKILVAGGKGFLGQALVQKLDLEGHTVISASSKQCDFSKETALPYLREISPDYIFHLAGKTSIPSSWECPNAFYCANVDTTRVLLEYCRESKTPMHYVSAYIYGNQGLHPISEDMAVQPNNPYAHSKWLAEELCRFYNRFFSLPITISRPFNIYGPGQSAHFFIPRVISQLRTQETIQVLDLTPKRDYVFVEDVAHALIAIMQRGTPGHCYNIGTGISFSCKEVIDLLQSLLGTHKSILSEGKTRPEEISNAQANRDKISEATGWQPHHSLEQGLTKCLSQDF
jgi:nucleoside-diphosphate-sugar epimerase